MAVAAKSRSFPKEKRDFNKLVFNKIFYLVVFSCINYPINAKYTFEKLIAK